MLHGWCMENAQIGNGLTGKDWKIIMNLICCIKDMLRNRQGDISWCNRHRSCDNLSEYDLYLAIIGEATSFTALSQLMHNTLQRCDTIYHVDWQTVRAVVSVILLVGVYEYHQWLTINSLSCLKFCVHHIFQRRGQLWCDYVPPNFLLINHCSYVITIHGQRSNHIIRWGRL